MISCGWVYEHIQSDSMRDETRERTSTATRRTRLRAMLSCRIWRLGRWISRVEFRWCVRYVYLILASDVWVRYAYEVLALNSIEIENVKSYGARSFPALVLRCCVIDHYLSLWLRLTKIWFRCSFHLLVLETSRLWYTRHRRRIFRLFATTLETMWVRAILNALMVDWFVEGWFLK